MYFILMEKYPVLTLHVKIMETDEHSDNNDYWFDFKHCTI